MAPVPQACVAHAVPLFDVSAPEAAGAVVTADGGPIVAGLEVVPLVAGQPAGTFRAGPAPAATVVERGYRQHTATLETTWAVGERQFTLTEAMVAQVTGRLLPATLLVRRLSAGGGAVDAAVEFDPRLGEHPRPPLGPRAVSAPIVQTVTRRSDLRVVESATDTPGAGPAVFRAQH